MELRLTWDISILFVHGLQGHPYKTWACGRHNDTTTSKSSGHDSFEPSSSTRKKRRKRINLNLLSIRNKTTQEDVQDQSNDGKAFRSGSRHERDSSAVPASPAMFWPADLLPDACPKARIMTWGYDTKITKYMVGRVNKNNVFSHAKDPSICIAA
jgi:hypothetical protein